MPSPRSIAARDSHPTKFRRLRPKSATILSAIAADALAGAPDGTGLITVPPATPGDRTLLFLRCDGQTQLMLAVPPHVIRSERLRRGTVPARDLGAEPDKQV